jgi:hypothetical protein
MIMALLLALSATVPVPAVTLPKEPGPEGSSIVYFVYTGDSLQISAMLPDTSYYWGDDLVISLDPDGSGGDAPGDGDLQWYLRRDLDSSLVRVGANGRWSNPAPIGKTRSGEGWSLDSYEFKVRWIVSVRMLAPGPKARFAVRTYDNAPHGWWSYPPPPEGQRATVVERTPKLWVPLPRDSK